jgi:methyl-accepting chemotaxis protein
MKFISKSLKAKLFVVFAAVSLVPLVAVTLISYNLSASALKNAIYDNLEAVTDSRSNHINSYIENDLITIAAIARGNRLEAEFEKPAPSAEVLEEIALKDAARFPMFGEVFIMDLSGKIVATSDKAHLGLDRRDDEYFKGALSGKTYFKSVYKSPVTGAIGYAVSAPIVQKSTNRIVGVAAARGDMAKLNKITMDAVGLGQTGELYIVNEDGVMITASRLSGGSHILSQKVDTQGVKNAMAGRDVLGIFKDYRGQDVLGHYIIDEDIVRLTGKRWCVVAEVDAAEAFAPLKRMTALIAMLIAFFAAAVVFVSLLISNGIAAPVKSLSLAAERVSSGDLATMVPVTGGDEIGQLAASFNAMTKSLSALVSKMRDSVGQISSASSEILAATQQQAAGAREQSAAVSETTAASKELSKSAEQVGDSIKRVLEVSTHALSGMSKIKGAIGKTGQIVTSLNEKSQKIGKITDVIDDVADQTNLLAVNAAIEAARAGEQGRGFTVVADEIRKLADSTAKSTKDITALIEVIQHEMSNAIMSMETSIVSVDEESKLSQESAERSEEIAMSATQQISGSKQIAEAMSDIDETMKQIAVSAQQSQAAVKQLAELGKELKDMIKRLA